eukprot:scaffold147890_cov21-Prasinocladus_malaysianus.AAC.1
MKLRCRSSSIACYLSVVGCELGNKVEGEFKAVTSKEKKEVVELGGLHVIGTERHESRRIDNQLRGRAGRQ